LVSSIQNYTSAGRGWIIKNVWLEGKVYLKSIFLKGIRVYNSGKSLWREAFIQGGMALFQGGSNLKLCYFRAESFKKDTKH